MQITWQGNLRVTLALILGLSGFMLFNLLVFAGANYAGVCLPQMRRLTEGEILAAAVNYANSRQTLPADAAGGKLASYADGAALLKANPQCCNVSRVEDPFSGGGAGDMALRVVGLLGAQVRLHYSVRYTDSSGRRHSRPHDQTLGLTNCGIVIRDSDVPAIQNP